MTADSLLPHRILNRLPEYLQVLESFQEACRRSDDYVTPDREGHKYEGLGRAK